MVGWSYSGGKVDMFPLIFVNFFSFIFIKDKKIGVCVYIFDQDRSKIKMGIFFNRF